MDKGEGSSPIFLEGWRDPTFRRSVRESRRRPAACQPTCLPACRPCLRCTASDLGGMSPASQPHLDGIPLGRGMVWYGILWYDPLTF